MNLEYYFDSKIKRILCNNIFDKTCYRKWPFSFYVVALVTNKLVTINSKPGVSHRRSCVIFSVTRQHRQAFYRLKAIKTMLMSTERWHCVSESLRTVKSVSQDLISWLSTGAFPQLFGDLWGSASRYISRNPSETGMTLVYICVMNTLQAWRSREFFDTHAFIQSNTINRVFHI